MYTLVFPSDSPPGGGRTVPRTVSRTALREDLQNSDGHSDSPSGGPSKHRRSLGQPFGRHSRTAPRALRSKLRPLYRVAHIRCHLSGRASPSRTSSYRKLDSLPALRKTLFVGGRERTSKAWYVYERISMGKWQPYGLLFIGKPRGRASTWKYQNALGYPFHKKEYAIWECHVELHGGAPPWPATLMGVPPMRCLAHNLLLEALFGISKKCFSKKSKICHHYSR